MLRAALKPTAPGQCGSCHSVERDAFGRLAIQWRPFDSQQERRGLTHFNHGPHILLPNTGDCTSCHRTAAHAEASYAGDDPQKFIADFEPMTKASCAACHTPHAAGDGCAQCHSYHAAH
jgi:cytochrome c554/c'-like protein